MSAAAPDFPFAGPPPPGTAREVAAGILWLRMPLPFALDHINLWLVREPDGWTAVDAGYGDAPTRALWERHFATTLGGAPIVRVIATHYHPDHLGNGAWLADRFGTGVWLAAAEYLTAHAIHGQHAGYALADTCALFRAHGVAPAHVDALAARGNAYARGVPELPTRFRRILPGEALTLGATRWHTLPGYGHSPEHLALYAADRGLLISGDMLLPKISTNVSVWPAEADGDPLARFLDSLRVFEALPPDTLVLPSHGLPFRGIGPRTAALRAHHRDRLAELEAALAETGGSATAAEVVPVLFRRELDLQQRFFAIGEAIAHLNHLWHAGRLHRRSDAGGELRFALPAAPAAPLE